jgi:7 transmembrane receptor (rhodopsin family)
MASTQFTLPDVHRVETSEFIVTTISSAAETDVYKVDVAVTVFQALVIFIGIIGTLANVIVLSTLVISVQPKKQACNWLFINQMSLDLFSCVWLVISYSVKLYNPYLSGFSGFLICALVVGENFVWFGLTGSVTNLACISIERYLMINHLIWHKMHSRPWMTYVAMTFAWISGILQTQIAMLTTSVTVNGQCFPLSEWPNYVLRTFFGTWAFFINYFIILVIITYSYVRILVKVRHQSRVFAVQHANNPLARTGKEINMRVQMNTVKTMILNTVL